MFNMLRNIETRMEYELKWTLYKFVREALEAQDVPFVEVVVVSAGFAVEAVYCEEKMWQKYVKARIVETERIDPQVLWFGLPFGLR